MTDSLIARRSVRLFSALTLTTALASPAFAGILIGEVTDSGETRAFAGSTITIEELGRTVEAGPGGFYRFGDVPAGTYTITARYVGAVPASQTVVVPETGDVRADFRLGTGATNDVSILVIGQAANLASALSRQRAADGIENVLTRDAIGQFPDQNAAESLRRVPGLSVQDDQGEGRFVVVRGLAPNLNSVSINGARVPSPEAGGREVPLDVIPSGLIESIEVRKTLTPDMDADAIGGSIEINSTSPFDRRQSQVVATLEGNYNDLVDAWNPKGSVDFTWLATDTFGISGGFSYYNRELGSDNIEAEDWGREDGVAFPEEIQFRNYDIERERIAGSLAFEYRPDAGISLYARGLASRFSDQEFRSRTILGFDGPPVGGDGTSAIFSADADPITVERELKDRLETQYIYSAVFGGDFEFDAWTINAQASYSYSRETEPDRIDSLFEREFEAGDDIFVTLTDLDTRTPEFFSTNGALFRDPSEYELAAVEFADGRSTDSEWAFQFDVARQFFVGEGSVTFQTGGKVRLRDKDFTFDFDLFEGFANGDDFPTLDGFATTGIYPLANISPFVDRSISDFVTGNIGAFERENADSDFDSAGAFYDVSEDIYAAYGLARVEVGNLRAIAGLRVERTDNVLRGNIVELVEEGGTVNGAVLDEDTVFVTPTEIDRNYTRWLPSVNLRWEPADNVVVRGAIYRALSRPNIEQIAPRFLVEESEGGEREGEFGNPALRPLDAWNYDLGIAWYFSGNAVIQGNVFYKEIDDFIATTVIDDQIVNGVFIDEGTIPINGESATVTGIELNLQAALDFLPSPFDGLLVAANYTYTDSEAEIFGRTVPLPATSENIWNATLGYEKYGLSLRATLSYRDDFLDEVTDDGDGDIWNQSRLLFDVSARYRITDNFQVFANFVNLTDEPYGFFTTGTAAGGNRLIQYEEYSWTATAGLRVTFP
ncbi:TonB-dependent receptor [Parasphingopyxis algicola]|uniref:TonB-dependent receptor n=1 Tax=Parasphingopyxis algicola TaxID=2026624 RepID=UPI0015A0508A|nr:TonB-dependent receptor [Parasphingopyxis algicola]QLC23631.1 TonB-dependent receptor [Parasphingopyxis algicola]